MSNFFGFVECLYHKKGIAEIQPKIFLFNLYVDMMFVNKDPVP